MNAPHGCIGAEKRVLRPSILKSYFLGECVARLQGGRPRSFDFKSYSNFETHSSHLSTFESVIFLQPLPHIRFPMPNTDASKSPFLNQIGSHSQGRAILSYSVVDVTAARGKYQAVLLAHKGATLTQPEQTESGSSPRPPLSNR